MIVSNRKRLVKRGDDGSPNRPAPAELWPRELDHWGFDVLEGAESVVFRNAHADSQEAKAGEHYEARYRCSGCGRYVMSFYGNFCRFCVARESAERRRAARVSRY